MSASGMMLPPMVNPVSVPTDVMLGCALVVTVPVIKVADILPLKLASVAVSVPICKG